MGSRAFLTCICLIALAPPSGSAQPRDPLHDAAARMRVHDFGGVLVELARLQPQARSTARAHYLEARAHDRLGRPARAAEAYAAAESGLDPAVSADARKRRALALARAGDCATARPLLEATSSGRGGRAAVARAWLGHCLVGLGDHERAIAILQRVVRANARSVDVVAARISLAQALTETGDRPAAIAALRAVLVTRPDHPEVAAVQAQLEALGADPELDVEARIQRAERLSEVRRHRDAVAELDAAGRPSNRALLARWLHVRGMALFKTRHDYAEAARDLGRAARLGGANAAEDAFHAARALSRADRDDEAIAAYRRFARTHARHARAAQAEYLAAWLELRHGRAAGERQMQRFWRGPRARARPRLRRDATWHLALRAFEMGRHHRAAELFNQYANMGTGPLVRGRGLYWLGRARQEAGNRGTAARAFRAAIGVSPLHWYALLARQRLTELGEEPPDPFGEASAPRAPGPELPPPPIPAAARFYHGLGLVDDARGVLRRHEAELRRTAPRGRGLELVVAAHRALGDVHRPYRLAVDGERAELARRPDGQNRWVWEAAYPRAFEPLLGPAARAEGLEPEYLWAIMRQESAYDPEALSYADAIGLLQMLPSTTERLAASMGVPYRREALFDPAVNVRFGAYYNAGLLRRMGEVPLAFGAFNAGAHRVRRWLRETGEMDLDRFVERIPFDQTRNYVRRVTSHYARYRYLRAPEDGWPLTLPARVGPRSLRR